MSMPRILHYPGSKWSMTSKIISHMPEHNTYLEPCLGSGAVFFNKPRVPLETINDLDGNIVNLFKVIRERPEELAQAVYWTPYAREEYNLSYQPGGENDLERARLFLVRCWMARGAKTSDRTGWRHVIDFDSRPLSAAHEWQKLPEKIITVTERLQGVQIECQPATKLMERYRKANVLIYLDPPYLLSTRSKRMYKHEMKVADHEELLHAALLHPGPVLLSGYAHQLYDDALKGWERHTFEANAEAGRVRTEVLWINPTAANDAGQQCLF